MPDLLYLEGLPGNFNKGKIVRLLIEDGHIRRDNIGRIVQKGHRASIEISGGQLASAVTLLDGNLVGTRQIRAWAEAQSGEHPYFDQLLEWIALEASAEAHQHRQLVSGGSNSPVNREKSMRRLVVRSEEIGLGGKYMTTFAPKNEQAYLPFSRLNVGSPVIVTEELPSTETRPPATWRGIVSRKRKQTIEVGLNRPIESEFTLRIDAAADEIGRERMKRGLNRVMNAKNDRLADLRDVILGEKDPVISLDVPAMETAGSFMADLNQTQIKAVERALLSQDVAIIHGPPGTGKTTAVSALILAEIKAGARVLACAPSNLAVDNLAEKLIAGGASVVRIGHPIRITEAIQAHTLDALVQEHDDYKTALKLRKEGQTLFAQSERWTRAKPQPGEKADMRREARAIEKEAKQLEAQAVDRVLNGAQVILSTLTGIDSAILGQRHFDVCVIDEAGQTTEPATWIPLVRSNKVVLAGDHLQLPPTVLSQAAAEAGYATSLLERLMLRDGRRLARRLEIQYRMHTDIMRFSSAEFYDDALQADGSVASHLLSDFDGVEENDLTRSPVTYIDTAGANFDESWDSTDQSRKNEQEAKLIAKKVGELTAAGVSLEQIGVITPYAAQVREIRSRLADEVAHGLEVGSVDGFQGREKTAVLISLVRSNPEGKVGFLAEARRMNVALTRARRKLLVIGDSATISTEPFYERFLAYIDAIDAYHPVWEEGV